MESWASDEPKIDEGLQKVFDFGNKNHGYAGCKIKVMPDGETPYTILGGAYLASPPPIKKKNRKKKSDLFGPPIFDA